MKTSPRVSRVQAGMWMHRSDAADVATRSTPATWLREARQEHGSARRRDEQPRAAPGRHSALTHDGTTEPERHRRRGMRAAVRAGRAPHGGCGPRGAAGAGPGAQGCPTAAEPTSKLGMWRAGAGVGGGAGVAASPAPSAPSGWDGE